MSSVAVPITVLGVGDRVYVRDDLDSVWAGTWGVVVGADPNKGVFLCFDPSDFEDFGPFARDDLIFMGRC